jgi:hypothetical protein
VRCFWRKRYPGGSRIVNEKNYTKKWFGTGNVSVIDRRTSSNACVILDPGAKGSRGLGIHDGSVSVDRKWGLRSCTKTLQYCSKNSSSAGRPWSIVPGPIAPETHYVSPQRSNYDVEVRNENQREIGRCPVNLIQVIIRKSDRHYQHKARIPEVSDERMIPPEKVWMHAPDVIIPLWINVLPS